MEKFVGFERLPEVQRFLRFHEEVQTLPVDENGGGGGLEFEDEERYDLLRQQAEEAVEAEIAFREEEEEELERLIAEYHP